MLTVYGRASSSNVQALTWGLAELGQDFTRLDRGFTYGGLDTTDFRAMNPHGKVPVLVHDDHPALWETGACLRYAATVFGQADFWPADPLQRALVDRWAEWAKMSIAMNFTSPIFWRVVRTAPSAQDQAAIWLAVTEFEDQLQFAEHQLDQNDWLAGDAFTLADIQFGHVLFRYFDINIDRRDLPNVAAYYARLTERDAFLQNVMVSYEELRVTE